MKYIIKYVMIVVVVLFAVNNLSAQYQLVKKWETDSLLKVPESVLYDSANEVLYVSNIDGKPDEKDGKGSIGKVGLDGKIITVDWVTGLNAPKGMAMVKNILWVADVDELAAIDLTTATIIKRIKINGAKFLNDVAADKDGTIYVSDSQTKMVHKVQNDQPSVFLDNLEGPNGVLVYNKSIYLLDNGKFYKVGKGKKLIKIADGLEGHTDGVEHVEGNDFIVSCWAGVIWYVKGDGSKQKLLDTRDQQINSADIGYDAKNKVVFVPTFFKNSVAAYQLQ
jgi:hypothetical protein